MFILCLFLITIVSPFLTNAALISYETCPGMNQSSFVLDVKNISVFPYPPSLYRQNTIAINVSTDVRYDFQVFALRTKLWKKLPYFNQYYLMPKLPLRMGTRIFFNGCEILNELALRGTACQRFFSGPLKLSMVADLTSLPSSLRIAFRGIYKYEMRGVAHNGIIFCYIAKFRLNSF